jgi:hypothetical protein
MGRPKYVSDDMSGDEEDLWLRGRRVYERVEQSIIAGAFDLLRQNPPLPLAKAGYAHLQSDQARPGFHEDVIPGAS